MVDLYGTGNHSIPQLQSKYGASRSTISGWIKHLSPVRGSDNKTISAKEYKALQKKIKEFEIENEI